MPTEMLSAIEAAKPGGMSRAEYIRRYIREDYKETQPVSESDGFATGLAEV